MDLVGWLVAIVLIVTSNADIARVGRALASDGKKWHEPERIIAAVSPLCDGVVYGQYSLWHWLNFVSGEQLCIADPFWERYAPYNRKLELSTRPAFLDDIGGLHEFLHYSGSKSKEMDLKSLGLNEVMWRSLRFSAIPFQTPEESTIHIDYNVTPPPNEWDYMDVSNVSQVKDHQGRSYPTALTDATLGTGWDVALKSEESAALTFEFYQPESLCGLRLMGLSENTPGSLAIDYMSPSDSNWQSALPRVDLTSFFWSGPYLKWGGIQCFPEVRFKCPEGGVKRLRLRVQFPDSSSRNLRVDEVLFLKQASFNSSGIPSLEECLSVLRQEKIRQFFGPRWITERLACENAEPLRLHTPSFVSRSVQDLPVTDASQPVKVIFDENTGLLMDVRDAPRSRWVLRQAGQHWTEKAFGELVLMIVSKATDENDGIQHTPIFWSELGCFAEEKSRGQKIRAERLFQKTKSRIGLEARLENLHKTLAFYPWHQPARQALVEALQTSGMTAEAAAQKSILSEQIQPDSPGPANFSGGITLVGVSLSPHVVSPGQSFQITYFWKCPPQVEPRRYAAFVNFQKGKERFQDDHSLLGDVPEDFVSYQPFDEVFSYTRSLTVPLTASPGDYGVVIGLVDSTRHNVRLKPVSALPVKKQGVHLKATISVK